MNRMICDHISKTAKYHEQVLHFLLEPTLEAIFSLNIVLAKANAALQIGFKLTKCIAPTLPE